MLLYSRFARLDLAMVMVSLDVASSITYSKIALSKHIPPGERHSLQNNTHTEYMTIRFIG